MKTEKEIRTELKNLFEDNEELFNDTIEELDSYNGYLGDEIWYDMGDLDELLSNNRATDFLLNSFNRGIATEYSPFNPNCSYFKLNAYGNLVSSDIKDYSNYLNDKFIDNLLDNHQYLALDADVEALLDELENAEQEEEE